MRTPPPTPPATPVTDRREFLAVLAGMSVGLPRARDVLSVDAVPTVFYGHPNGERNLVRLIVTDTTVPAGRIRVYGPRRQLLGTAGVLGTGGRLVGELLLPISRATTVTTELEIPGRSSPLRSQHTLRPPPQWTMHWVVVAEPDRLIERLDGLAPYPRAITLALLDRARVTGNPFAAGAAPALADHLAFLRLAAGARELERRFGVPSSGIAVAPATALGLDAATTALHGAGVSHAVILDAPDGSGFRVLYGRDGSRIVAAAPTAGVDPHSLGFGTDRMSTEIETWLLGPARQVAIGEHPTTLVVSRDIDDQLARMMAAVEDWNRRFAYPRIVVGEAAGYFDAVAREVEQGHASAPMSTGWSDAPAAREVRAAAELRHAQVEERWQSLLRPVTTRFGMAQPQLEDVAASLSTALPGVLVFNPSPVSATDRFIDPQGRERVVTNAPPVGYVYLPDIDAPAPPYLFPGTLTVSGRNVTVRLDDATGAIISMADLASSTEWAHGRGLNAVRGARLERAERWALPGVGGRLIAYRSTPYGVMRTVVTAYDDNSWIDVENVIDGTQSVDEIEFNLARRVTRVAYETPVGWEEDAPPTSWYAHLRWMELHTDEDARLLMRGFDTPWARVDADPTADETVLRSMCPMTGSRFRLQISGSYAGPDERWYFGWRGDPLHAAAVPGTGTRSIPSYGRFVQTDIGALLIGLREDDLGGLIAYVQDITGADRTVSVRPGLLSFTDARRVDLIGRDMGEPLPLEEGAVKVRLPRYGVTALHIRGVSLAGG